MQLDRGLFRLSAPHTRGFVPSGSHTLGDETKSPVAGELGRSSDPSCVSMVCPAVILLTSLIFVDDRACISSNWGHIGATFLQPMCVFGWVAVVLRCDAKVASELLPP